MYKAIFSLLSILPVFILSFLDGEDVSITQKIPEKIEIGESYQVDLIFNKGEAVQGFGKFQTEFPSGISITIKEAAGATFTYAEGVMKLIWVNLPSESQFVVSYEISASEEASGKIQIGGKFSCLLDNERKSFAIFPETVQVGDEEALAASDAEEDEELEEFSLNVFRKVQKTAENKYDVSFVIQKSGIQGFSKIEEYVPRGALVEGKETMNASFSYMKNKIKFVWLATPEDKEMIVTYAVDLSSASDQDVFNTYGEYSYLDADNKAQKVLFDTRQANMKIPEKVAEPLAEEKTEETPKELNIGGVNIKLREATEEEIAEMNASENKTEESPSKESPQQQNRSEEMAQVTQDKVEEELDETPEAESIELANEVAKSTSNGSDKKADESITEVKKEAKEEVVAVKTDEPKPAKKKELQRPEEPKELNAQAGSKSTNPNISAPQNGVFYKVQIAAGKNVVDAKYFEQKHQWSNPFVIENHEGWVKYTTDLSFPVYKEARDKRNEITTGFNFDGPFVTAYNAGERITVQEALMISNQKWFK